MIRKHLFKLLRPFNVSSRRSFVMTPRVNQDKVRVRFAPSPTGKLHLGGLRTAMLNYVFARKHNGEFLLRIEDTDQERYKADALDNLLAGLKWVGIVPTFGPHCEGDSDAGGPWFQSKRLGLYHEHVRILLESKHAYRCFCDEARLDLMRTNAIKNKEVIKYDGRCRQLKPEDVERFLAEGRPHVIRYRIPDKEVAFEDMVTGTHKFNLTESEGDFIIIKSDKFPTYHFANVIDDHLMRITHVLRGIEWQTSTPKHILMYESFGWKHPVYGHLPLLLNLDGSKLSKRQNDIDVLSYRDRSYFPESVLTYLACIGSGFNENKGLSEQLFANENKPALEHLVELFDEKNILQRPVKLNAPLLDNLNKRFLQLKLKDEREALLNELTMLVRKKFQDANQTLNEQYVGKEYLNSILSLSADRVKNLQELVDSKDFNFLWHDMSNFSQVTQLKKEPALELLESMIAFLDSIDSEAVANNSEQLKQQLKALFSGLKLQNKSKQRRVKGTESPIGEFEPNAWELARLILIGLKDGPPLSEIICTLGKDNLIHRLNVAKNIISKI